VLESHEPCKTIEESGSLVLHGAGWESRDEAVRHGQFYADILARVYVRLKLGADFGERGAGGRVTDEGLASISQKTGRPTLRDVHGLMVYDQSRNPSFVSIQAQYCIQAKYCRAIPMDSFLSVYNAALQRPREISDRERIAILMFNASFFQESPNARLIILMMGLEALIERLPLPESVQNIIQGLMNKVDGETGFSEEEKGVLKSKLGELKKESIRQAGRRIIRERLNHKNYGNKCSEDFFDECYELRSRLVHGDRPLPERDEVANAASGLEKMLSDLLSFDLLDVG
jgi:hypothetical protein